MAGFKCNFFYDLLHTSGAHIKQFEKQHTGCLVANTADRQYMASIFNKVSHPFI